MKTVRPKSVLYSAESLQNQNRQLIGNSDFYGKITFFISENGSNNVTDFFHLDLKQTKALRNWLDKSIKYQERK